MYLMPEAKPVYAQLVVMIMDQEIAHVCKRGESRKRSYTNNKNLVCYKSCTTCSGKSPDECTSCPANFSLQANNTCACVSPYVLTAGSDTCECPVGSYDDGLGNCKGTSKITSI
jgi:hypothetical protein